MLFSPNYTQEWHSNWGPRVVVFCGWLLVIDCSQKRNAMLYFEHIIHMQVKCFAMKTLYNIWLYPKVCVGVNLRGVLAWSLLKCQWECVLLTSVCHWEDLSNEIWCDHVISFRVCMCVHDYCHVYSLVCLFVYSTKRIMPNPKSICFFGFWVQQAMEKRVFLIDFDCKWQQSDSQEDRHEGKSWHAKEEGRCVCW